jgi:phospholipid/cholesterol/gamma-HCH transport system permease protein
VETLFHEFGHGLHHMLTRVDYPGVAGINGVAWDAVELPSQFLENWCWERESLDLFAHHYRTGEPLPAELLDKMQRARNFHSGMQMLRQLEFSLFDFRLHADPAPRDAAGIQALLDEVRRRSEQERPADETGDILSRLAGGASRLAGNVGREAVLLTGFLGALTTTFGRIAARPWRFRPVSFVHHLDHAGFRAVPIIALICVLIGAVVMQQGVVQLRAFGAETFAVNMVGILSLREVGVLLTAIMVAGRSGSAFTAEIGSMKMREEIDAMRTLGIDPMETLVAPRVLALIVALPLLTFLGDMMCLFGGGLMAKFYLGLDGGAYISHLHDAVDTRHFLAGMVKAPIAALIIGLVGCLEGLKVTGSAESLGFHVTSAVVKAIFLVIVFDALFAMFLSAVGI